MSSSSLTYTQALLMGGLQGISELFPVSSLGHSVLIPALVGGSWATTLSLTPQNSPYLAFLVAMHVATALALVIFFWQDWVRVIGGLFSSIRDRRIQTVNQRLAWMLIVGTIPVGIAGVALDRLLRSKLGTPGPTSIFLILNGIVLGVAELLRRRAARGETPVQPGRVAVAEGLTPEAQYRYGLRERQETGQFVVTGFAPPPSYGDVPTSGRRRRRAAADEPAAEQSEGTDTRLARLGWKNALLIGASQSLGLVPGFSRSGATMSTGLLRGLTNEDAVRFAFLLATPVILAAGLYKIPELFGPDGKGIGGQVLVGSLVAGVCAYISARFLTRYFETKTLTPFAIYCVLGGAVCLAVLH